MSPEEKTVLELVWSHYKKHGDWPQKTRFSARLRQQGLDLGKLAGGERWIHVGSEWVNPTLQALLTLPEVRQLLEPLPALLRLLARRFVEQADLDENPDAPKPRVEASEFFALWGDGQQERALGAARLLEQFLGWYVRRAGGLDSSQFYFAPELDNLRYEHVASLDELMTVRERPYGTVRSAPQGKHLAVLQEAYTSVRETGQWPGLVRLTLKHRDTLGFIPDLVTELQPVFVRELRSDYREPRRIALTNQALPYVAGAADLALAARIVRAVAELWLASEHKPHSAPSFTIEQIAEKLSRPVRHVLPVARLLEDQPWGWVHSVGGRGSSWSVMVHERVIEHFMEVQSWDEYVRIRDERSPNHELPYIMGDSPQAEAIEEEESDGPATAANVRPKVFIGHGRSELWRALKDFLRDELELDPVEFNDSSVAGKLTVQRLEEMLDECDLAFLVMTAEVPLTDDSMQARPNVIHEIGLCQGRLGFDRTIILRQEGCAEFSNNAGLNYIEFPANKIKASFEEVRQVVRDRLSEPKPRSRR